MANSNCFYLFGLEHNHRKCRLTRLGFYSNTASGGVVKQSFDVSTAVVLYHPTTTDTDSYKISI